MNSKDPLLLSVIFFVRNLRNTVVPAIESVFQNRGRIELLVLDGGSTDGTVEVLHRYRAKMSYFRSGADGGAVFAVNEGIAKANGNVVCLLSGDDWLEPGALDHVMEQFSSDEHLEILTCGARFVETGPEGRVRVLREFGDEKVLRLELNNVIRHPLTHSRFVRRDIYARLGCYDPSFTISNDLDFLIRACLSRPNSRVSGRIVYNYRVHSESKTLNPVGTQLPRMLHENILVAEKHQERCTTRSAKKALRELHGRACVHAAALALKSRRVKSALEYLLRGLRQQPLLPLKLVYWLVQRPFVSRPSE